MLTQIRKFENIHIVLWLIKDSCWMLQLKFIGSIMIIPAIGLAVFITLLSAKQIRHFFLNLSVVFWIVANSLWMLNEFYNWPLKTIAIAFFIAGLAVIVVHYLIIYYLYKKLIISK